MQELRVLFAKRWFFSILLSVALILPWLSWQMSRGNSCGFENTLIELKDRTLLMGEKVTVQAKLYNRRTEAVVVRSWRRSCGCMASDLDKNLPLRVAPGTSQTVEILVNTLGRSGPQRFFFGAMLQTERGETLPDADLEISTFVRVPLYVHPAEVVCDSDEGQPVKFAVDLVDQWDESPAPAIRVETSDNQRIKTRLEPTSGKIFVASMALNKRYRLVGEYTPKVGDVNVDERIKIYSDPRAAPTELHIGGKIRRDYQFVPDVLTIFGAEPESLIKREVVFRSKLARVKPTVLTAPDGTRVTMKPKDQHQLVLQLACAVPSNSMNTQCIFEIPGSNDKLALPIRFIVTPIREK